MQAQDRLFQMDLWRRAAQGRLSEVLGLNFVERDAMTRRVQYHGDIRRVGRLWSWREGHRGGLRQWCQRVGGRGARKRCPKSSRWRAGFRRSGARRICWTGRTPLLPRRRDADVLRVRLVAALGAQRAAEWFGAASPYRIPAGLDPDAVSPVVGEALRRVGNRAVLPRPCGARDRVTRSRRRFERLGRHRREVGHGPAAARGRSAPRPRAPVAPISRAPQRPGMERHRRGIAVAARSRHGA